MSALDLFRNDEFELSITPHETDGFHVVAAGVARALGFRDAFRLVETIPDNEKGYTTACTPGASVWYLTEAGFYRSLGQRQPARIKDKDIRRMVERFQAWVYGEVLPSMRAGAIVPAQRADLSRRDLALMVIEAEDARQAAEEQVAALAPRAEAWDDLADGEGDYLVGDAAKVLCRVDGISTGQNRLYRYLSEIGWVFRTEGSSGPWRAYQTAVDRGWLTERLSTGFHVSKGELVNNPPQVRVTVKGLERLRTLLAPKTALRAVK